MEKFDVKQALMEYHPKDDREALAVREILRFLNDNPDSAFDRTNTFGHITGSALVVDENGSVLLNHHKKVNIWIQFGGHCDGERDVKKVALRETIEESGLNLKDLEFMTSGIYSCAIYDIPANRTKGEPAHKHYDIVFLIKTKNRDFHLSSESTELRWCSPTEAIELVNGDAVCVSMIESSRKFFRLNKDLKLNKTPALYLV